MTPQNTLTPAQLERAARAACRNLGLDPDKTVAHGAEPSENGVICDILLYSPQWTQMIGAVQRHHAISTAVMEVLNEP